MEGNILFTMDGFWFFTDCFHEDKESDSHSRWRIYRENYFTVIIDIGKSSKVVERSVVVGKSNFCKNSKGVKKISCYLLFKVNKWNKEWDRVRNGGKKENQPGKGVVYKMQNILLLAAKI